MGMKYKTVGGQAAPGSLGGDFASWLQNGLMGNGFGNPTQTGGISGILNDILGGGAGHLGGALQQLLQTQQTNDVNSIRSRYGVGGGTGFGTPAAYGESTYRAQAAPQIATAVGNLQLQALGPILQQIGALSQRQTPQAQTVGQQNPFIQALGAVAPIAGQVIGASMGMPNLVPTSTGSTGAGNLQPMNLDLSGFTPGNLSYSSGPSYNPFQFGSGSIPGGGFSLSGNVPNFNASSGFNPFLYMAR
jgi:hypothetical protein